MVATGYGNQTALFAPKVAKHHPLAISSFYGLEGAPIMWEGEGQTIPVFAGLGTTYGNEWIQGHANAFFGGNERGGLVFTLMDVLALDPDVYGKLNAACWTPVDHDPVTPTQRNFFNSTTAFPIAMSRYGEEALEEFDPYYVPHGIDCKVYKPLDRAEVRKALGVEEDIFIVGMVAANKGNPSRKCFSEAIQAFARLYEKHDNAVLYLHTETSGLISQGPPVLEIAGACGLPPEAVQTTDQYRYLFVPAPAEEMAAIYSAFDVLLAPSMGEGFGIPLMEAQACGIPVIGTDFSAMKEVIGAGWKVGGQKFWTGQRSFQMLPFIDEIYEALEEAYGQPSLQEAQLREKARRHALKYDADWVMQEYMLPVLADIEERLGDLPNLKGATHGEVQERLGLGPDDFHPGAAGPDHPGGEHHLRDDGQGNGAGTEGPLRRGDGEVEEEEDPVVRAGAQARAHGEVTRDDDERAHLRDDEA